MYKIITPIFIWVFVIFSNTNTIAQIETSSLHSNENFLHSIEQAHSQYFALSKFERQNNSIPQNYIIELISNYYSTPYFSKFTAKTYESKLKQFVETYPYSQLSQPYFFVLGNIEFNRKKYKEAQLYYQSVDLQFINQNLKADFIFNNGFIAFQQKNFEEAKRYWNSLVNEEQNKYFADANYYMGYMQYLQNDYEKALAHLAKIDKQPNYKKVVPYYIVTIYTLQQKNSEALVYGKEALKNDDLYYKTEMEYILGQTFFKEKNYKEAQPLLENYIVQTNKVRKEDIYQLAFTQFKNEEYEKCITNFKQLNNTNDSLSQNAMFHLGHAYLKLKEKNKATNAYQLCSKMNFDKTITEESKFIFAKLTAEQGQSKQGIESLKDFIVHFPNSKFQMEAKEILTDLYLNGNNYQEVLEAIESMNGAKSSKILKAYNTAAYNRAVELYNNNKVGDAFLLFQKVESNADQNLYSKAQFWMGEIQYELKNYEASILLYKKFLNGNSIDMNNNASMYTAKYNLAYCYFMTEKYQEALQNFNSIQSAFGQASATQRADITMRKINNDITLRLADCEFMLKQYETAAQHYQTIYTLGESNAVYASYQLALVKGLQGLTNEKLVTLKEITTLYPKSMYADDAYFEIAKTLAEQNNTSEAIKTYLQLQSTYPNSPLLAKAKNNIALLYINENNENKALTYYKEVLKLQPHSDEGKEALNGIKNVYIEKGDAQGYLAYINQEVGIDISSGEKDSLMYESIENQYLLGQCSNTIQQINEYLNTFPNGWFVLSARFYRAECLFKESNYTEAFTDYEFILNKPEQSITEQALKKASWISHYKLQDYNKAYNLYSRWLQISSYKENQVLAYKGKMECAFALEKYDETIEMANTSLKNEELPSDELTMLYYYLGKSNFMKGNFDLAMGHFKRMENYQANVYTAEGQYLIAEIIRNNSEWEACKLQCLKIADNYSSYEYWVVKAFLIMADISIKEKDYFQAKATLQSIIDGYNGDQYLLKLTKEKYAEAENKEKENTKIIDNTVSPILEMDSTTIKP